MKALAKLVLCKMLGIHKQQYRIRAEKGPVDLRVDLKSICIRGCGHAVDLNGEVMAVDYRIDGKVSPDWYLPGNPRAEKGWGRKKKEDRDD